MIRPEVALVLAADVAILPVSGLDESTRGGLLEADGEHFAVTRRTGRAPSTLVDASLAAVLEQFRSPSTVAEAIVRYSAQAGVDPAKTLDDAYLALRRCFDQGYLVEPDDARAGSRVPLLRPGQEFAGGRVVRCVHEVEDSEVYQVVLSDGRLLAAKIVRATSSAPMAALDREAEVLEHLAGRVAPRLVSRGESDGRRWLAMEWCHGSAATSAAAGHRGGSAPAAALLGLARRVAEAYAALHALGVVHGDVHPGNMILAPTGEVRLIDFGLSLWAGGSGPPPGRGGVLQFYDPAQAAALLEGRPPPPASESSDVYALGAVLHELLTGRHYLDLSLEHDLALRQIVDKAPVGDPAWAPEVAALLGSALDKEPNARVTAEELARGLSSLAPVTSAGGHASKGLDQVLKGVLSLAGPDGAWFEDGLPQTAPACSVFYGAAGLAAALRRVAVLRSDPGLVTLADEWITRAAATSARPDAFTSAVLGVSERETGSISPFHRLSGVHAVDALVSHARADEIPTAWAVRRFVATSSGPVTNVDLTLGTGGVLLTTAMLLETIGITHPAAPSLLEYGAATSDALWHELERDPAIAAATRLEYLGTAHGWAGVLLAALRWHAASKTPVPVQVTDRLEQLAALARPAGLGVWWPATNNHDRRGWSSHAGGWCHGSAGYVHLWSTAHAVLGEPRWAELAERAGWDVYATRTNVGQLCCGSCGQAYALLALFQLTGARTWLERAFELAVYAASSASNSGAAVRLPASLFKGDVAIAALAVDLEHPDDASMPFFGPNQ